MKTLKTTLAIGLLIVSSAALAGGNKYGHDKRQYPGQHDSFDYAQVIDARPIYREVEVSRPVRECWDEPVYREAKRRHTSSGDMLAGGIIGGIIGHHVGKGQNRGIATAVGTLIGAQIGSHSAGDRGRRHSEPTQIGRREQCETTQRISYERVIDAYAVSYRYLGKRYEVEMPYDPGKRIKMHVQITPVI